VWSVEARETYVDACVSTGAGGTRAATRAGASVAVRRSMRTRERQRRVVIASDDIARRAALAGRGSLA